MAVYKRGRVWWYRSPGMPIRFRESTDCRLRNEATGSRATGEQGQGQQGAAESGDAARRKSPRPSFDARRRERYLEGTAAVGEAIQQAYLSALEGIRATVRGQQPIEPVDPFLLRDVATVLVDCGLRPDECFRLRWEHVRDGALHVPFGKTKNARRTIPLTPRAGGVDRDAAQRRQWRVGLPRADAKRAHGEVHAEEAASEGLSTREGCSVLTVHVPAHLPDAMGRVHGPVHAGVS